MKRPALPADNAEVDRIIRMPYMGEGRHALSGSPRGLGRGTWFFNHEVHEGREDRVTEIVLFIKIFSTFVRFVSFVVEFPAARISALRCF